MPRALLFFRWGAVVTWIFGAALLGGYTADPAARTGSSPPSSLQGAMAPIGLGAWLGTIMLLNVWGMIWRNQKRVLGIVPATDEQKAKARRIAFLASRANTMLSIPDALLYGHRPHVAGPRHLPLGDEHDLSGVRARFHSSVRVGRGLERVDRIHERNDRISLRQQRPDLPLEPARDAGFLRRRSRPQARRHDGGALGEQRAQVEIDPAAQRGGEADDAPVERQCSRSRAMYGPPTMSSTTSAPRPCVNARTASTKSAVR